MAKTGEQHHAARLNERDVRSIRRLRYIYGYKIAYLAVRYDVGKTTIRDALTRHTWAHVK